MPFDCLNRKLRYNLCFQRRLHAGRTHSSTESLWSLVRITRYCLLASPWLARRLGFYEARDLGRRFSLLARGRDARCRYSRFHRPPLRQLEALSRHLRSGLKTRSHDLAAIFEFCGSLPFFSPVTSLPPTLSGSRAGSCDTILICIPELTSH